MAYRNERLTRAHPVTQPETGASAAPVCVCDNWRVTQSRDLEIGPWRGTTTLVFQGFGLPWLLEEDRRLGERSRTRSLGRAGAGGGGENGTSSPQEGGENLHEEAVAYISTINGLGQPTKQGWERVLNAGDTLLQAAGGVEEAAQWLWDARAVHGLANLRGVEDPCLDKILHPDLLAYLRRVKRHMAWRRDILDRENLPWLVYTPTPRRTLSKCTPKSGRMSRSTVSWWRARTIPAWAIPWPLPLKRCQLLPDRSVSKEVRVVHDQRPVNQGTHKAATHT